MLCDQLFNSITIADWATLSFEYGRITDQQIPSAVQCRLSFIFLFNYPRNDVVRTVFLIIIPKLVRITIEVPPGQDKPVTYSVRRVPTGGAYADRPVFSQFPFRAG